MVWERSGCFLSWRSKVQSLLPWTTRSLAQVLRCSERLARVRCARSTAILSWMVASPRTKPAALVTARAPFCETQAYRPTFPHERASKKVCAFFLLGHRRRTCNRGCGRSIGACWVCRTPSNFVLLVAVSPLQIIFAKAQASMESRKIQSLIILAFRHVPSLSVSMIVLAWC